MKDNTRIDSINLREAIARNRRLLIARERPEVRAWILYSMISLSFLASVMLATVLHLVGN